MAHITVYEHANYAGTSQKLGPGHYNVNQLPVGNDTISSLRIPSGWTVTLYEHAGFQGRRKMFHRDTSYVGDHFNDTTSSIVVKIDAQIKVFAPGEEAPGNEFKPGDFILTRGDGVFSRLIRIGQSLRYRGGDRKYAQWNHAAMIVSQQGNLIEALGSGVLGTHISRYKEKEYYLVHLDTTLADERDRAQIVKFAESTQGQPYGWPTIVCIAMSLLTGGKFTFRISGQFICSGLVARALERSDAIFDGTPSHTMPADLAKLFDVPPPKSETTKWRIPMAIFSKTYAKEKDHYELLPDV